MQHLTPLSPVTEVLVAAIGFLQLELSSFTFNSS